MNIPSFWATYTLEVPFENSLTKHTKIKRYGWSNDHVDAAKQHAIERCREAEQTLLTTGIVKRIEAKGSYSVTGLPIREEVVKKYPSLHCVTTINVYGSICLNTEDVMMLDIDNDNDDLQCIYIQSTCNSNRAQPSKISIFWVLLSIILLVIVANMMGGHMEAGLQLFLIGIIFGFLAMLVFSVNSQRWNKWFDKQGGYDGMLDSFVVPFIDKYPDMVFNIYKTPLGFRLIALGNTYSATDAYVQRCFDELPVDTKYARLCQLQNCFRARVTAKPWNIDDCEPRIPFKDFWVDTKMQQERKEWLQHYHKLASAYAACHFVKQVGKRQSIFSDANAVNVYDYIDEVVALHDGLSHSNSEMPLA